MSRKPTMTECEDGGEEDPRRGPLKNLKEQLRETNREIRMIIHRRVRRPKVKWD
jgi:hypothetical protein